MPTSEIVDITNDRLEEAAEVLATAFSDDPLMRHLFREMQDPQQAIRKLMKFVCEERLIRQWPLWGSVDGGRIAGVIAISPSDPPEMPPEMHLLLSSLARSLGGAAWERFGKYIRATKAQQPLVPHLYVGAIGVHPSYQRKGHARRLLERVHLLAEGSVPGMGVALDVENPTNLALYKRFGYQVIAETSVDGLKLWTMFRFYRV